MMPNSRSVWTGTFLGLLLTACRLTTAQDLTDSSVSQSLTGSGVTSDAGVTGTVTLDKSAARQLPELKVTFSGPDGAWMDFSHQRVGITTAESALTGAVVPTTAEFYQGAHTQWRIARIPGHPGLRVFAHVTTGLAAKHTSPQVARKFLEGHAIPFELTNADLNELANHREVRKVMYLPHTDAPEFKTLTSTQTDEARKDIYYSAVRLGTPFLSVFLSAYQMPLRSQPATSGTTQIRLTAPAGRITRWAGLTPQSQHTSPTAFELEHAEFEMFTLSELEGIDHFPVVVGIVASRENEATRDFLRKYQVGLHVSAADLDLVAAGHTVSRVVHLPGGEDVEAVGLTSETLVDQKSLTPRRDHWAQQRAWPAEGSPQFPVARIVIRRLVPGEIVALQGFGSQSVAVARQVRLSMRVLNVDLALAKRLLFDRRVDDTVNPNAETQSLPVKDDELKIEHSRLRRVRTLLADEFIRRLGADDDEARVLGEPEMAAPVGDTVTVNLHSPQVPQWQGLETVRLTTGVAAEDRMSLTAQFSGLFANTRDEAATAVDRRKRTRFEVGSVLEDDECIVVLMQDPDSESLPDRGILTVVKVTPVKQTIESFASADVPHVRTWAAPHTAAADKATSPPAVGPQSAIPDGWRIVKPTIPLDPRVGGSDLKGRLVDVYGIHESGTSKRVGEAIVLEITQPDDFDGLSIVRMALPPDGVDRLMEVEARQLTGDDAALRLVPIVGQVPHASRRAAATGQNATQSDMKQIEIIENRLRMIPLDWKATGVIYDEDLLGAEITVEGFEGNGRSHLSLQGRRQGVGFVFIHDDNGRGERVRIVVKGDADYLQHVIDRRFPDVSVQVSKIQVAGVLTGDVPDEETARQIVEIAEQFYPQILNHMRIIQRTTSGRANENHGGIRQTGAVAPAGSGIPLPGPVIASQPVILGDLPRVNPLDGVSRAPASQTSSKSESTDSLQEILEEVRALRAVIQELQDDVSGLRQTLQHSQQKPGPAAESPKKTGSAGPVTTGSLHVFTLSDNKAQVLETHPDSGRILRVDEFDPQIVEVTAISPTSLRLQPLKTGTTRLKLTLDGNQGSQQPLAVHVDVIVSAGGDSGSSALMGSGNRALERQAPIVRLQEPALPDEVRKGMAVKVSLHFENSELKDVIRFLHEAAGLNVVIEAPGLAEEGVTVATPVTIDVDDISMQSALNLVLEPLNLGWDYRNEVVRITSLIRIKGPLVAAAYPVSDLLMKDENLDEGLQRIERIVMKAIESESWSEVGGYATIQSSSTTRSLIVRQTRDAHREIVALLMQLQQLRKEGNAFDLSDLDGQKRRVTGSSDSAAKPAAPQLATSDPGLTTAPTTDDAGQTDEDTVWQQLGLKLTPLARDSFAKDGPYKGGMRVSEIRPGSPAAASGLKTGDVLVGLHVWETVSRANATYAVQHAVEYSLKSLRFYCLRDSQTLVGHLPLQQ